MPFAVHEGHLIILADRLLRCFRYRLFLRYRLFFRYGYHIAQLDQVRTDKARLRRAVCPCKGNKIPYFAIASVRLSADDQLRTVLQTLYLTHIGGRLCTDLGYLHGDFGILRFHGSLRLCRSPGRCLFVTLG